MHHVAPQPTREREGGRDNRGGLRSAAIARRRPPPPDPLTPAALRAVDLQDPPPSAPLDAPPPSDPLDAPPPHLTLPLLLTAGEGRAEGEGQGRQRRRGGGAGIEEGGGEVA
jgi:hypothetical protein